MLMYRSYSDKGIYAIYIFYISFQILFPYRLVQNVEIVFSFRNSEKLESKKLIGKNHLYTALEEFE